MERANGHTDRRADVDNRLSSLYYSFDEAKLLACDADSPVSVTQQSLTISLDWHDLRNWKAALQSRLDALRNHFDSRFDAILLASRRLRVHPNALVLPAYETILPVVVQGEFVLFRAKPGSILRGRIISVHRTHVALLIYDLFNARARIEAYHDSDSENYYEMHFEVGQDDVEFRVDSVSYHANMPMISGTLPHDDTELSRFRQRYRSDLLKNRETTAPPFSVQQAHQASTTRFADDTPTTLEGEARKRSKTAPMSTAKKSRRPSS